MSKVQNEKQEEKVVPVQLSLNIEQEVSELNSEAEIEKQIQESEQTVKQFKSKKKKIRNAIFFIANILLIVGILIFQISKETIMPIAELLVNFRIGWFLLCIFIYILVLFMDTYPFYRLIKMSTKKRRPYLAFKVSVLGKHYDAVTPMASGGQPFQIYYLTHRGIEASNAIFVTMGRYVSGLVSWIVFCLSIIIIAFKSNFGSSFSIIGVASLISITLSVLAFLFIILLSISKKIGKKLVVNVLKFLEKIRIVKNYEKQYLRVMKIVNDYQNIMRSLVANFWTFLFLFFLHVFRIFIRYSIAFFIYCALFGFDASLWIEIVCVCAMIDLTSGFVPVPGGSGVTEISFTAILGPIFGGSVFWAMLIWRFFSFYLDLLMGISVITYDYVAGNKKYTWLKRKWELESESEKFKEEQLMLYKKKKNSKLKQKE